MQEEFPGHKQVPNTQTTKRKQIQYPHYFFIFFLLSLSVLIYKVVEGLQWYYGGYGGVLAPFRNTRSLADLLDLWKTATATKMTLPTFSYREKVTVPSQLSLPGGSKTNSVYSQPWNRFDKRPKKEKQICGQRLLRKWPLSLFTFYFILNPCCCCCRCCCCCFLKHQVT